MQSCPRKPAVAVAAAGLGLLLVFCAATDAVAESLGARPAAPSAEAGSQRSGRGASAKPPAPVSPESHPVPAAVLTTLRGTGVPLKDFGVHVRAVDALAPTMSLNAEQTYYLASTTKVVTSLAALNLLGAGHQWLTRAHSSTPVRNGRMAGDLVIAGGTMGMTPAELRRWFKQMRSEGLSQISGRIVLDRFSLLYEAQPAQALAKAATPQGGVPPNPSTYNSGASVVVVQPTKGELARVSLQPDMPGVVIVNEMLMGGTSAAVCGARVRWGEAPATGSSAMPPLLVSGRWVLDCGRQEVAFVMPPTAGATALAMGMRSQALDTTGTARQRDAVADAVKAKAASPVSMPDMVASLWAEAGGQLRGGVVEAAPPSDLKARAPERSPRATRAWASQSVTSMPEMMRELNKTSNNDAARDLLLSLAMPPAPELQSAQGRVGAWLREQGLADGDLTIDQGSGQSRLERGRPRAMVQLLVNQWRAKDARVFVDSLPIAGVDGTLAHRMRNGPAAGRAFMKTGTLSDTRALAGYVMGQSGKVYAVALFVNHPQAARATPALDALVEWLAKNG